MRAGVRRAAAAGIGGVLLGVVAVSTLTGAARRAPGAAAPAGAVGVSTPPVPARLSETGLYLADGTVDPRNRPFVPQYPLWSDGAEKSRWIRLPEGRRIDVSDVDAWRFPAGTVLWKEFAWDGRKVETRMLRAEPDGRWTFATYVWNEDQSDALLAPAEGIPAFHEIAPGKRHSIPAVADCNACHGSSPATVLGFNALQLSDDRDPLAPHAEPLRPGALTLGTLVAEDLLNPARPELASWPPRIRADDPVARAAQGYLSANCGGCHNARGPLARLGFDLLHEVGTAPDAPERAQATAVGAASRYVVPDVAPADCRIVAPGVPDHSALLHRMRSRRPSSQMPPLGTVIPVVEAIEVVRRWIESLGSPTS
jgi:hypothetical protein